MKISSQELINDLVERTKNVLNQAEELKQLSVEDLNQKIAPEAWSALECIEHLNRYGDFYIPEISQRIKHANSEKKEVFKSGKLGNYFAKMMLPREKLNKMKTFKEMNPLGSTLTKDQVDKFIHQQKQMLDLLDAARNIDLTRTKTSITISKLIKLRLGDTFRVVIYHNQRHLIQAQKAAGQA